MIHETAVISSKVCPQCGETFTKPKRISRQQWADRVNCSRYCAHRARSGEGHEWWGGGRTVDGKGYVRVKIGPDHPFASMALKNWYVLEHRLVMAEALGRPLTKDEEVHHKNGVRDQNDIGNLELRTLGHGKGATRHCLTCRCAG